MKPQVVLSFAGLLMLFAPGCCVFEAIFGWGHCRGYDSCGSVDGCGCDGGHKHKNKCDKKCRKCRECLEKEGLAGGGYGAGYPGMGYGDFGFSGDGGCGCGGGASCGCGQGGMGGPSTYESSFMTPPMTVPTPNANPGSSGTALPPPIPSTESSSNIQPVPAGMQQVSVEEFQRLPGVIVSGPGASPMSTSVPQVSAQLEMTVPTVMAPSPAAKPISSVTSAPVNAKQIQQTGWAPVRQ